MMKRQQRKGSWRNIFRRNPEKEINLQSVHVLTFQFIIGLVINVSFEWDN
jgi:hypothetical protein